MAARNAHLLIDAKPETRLMSALFDRPFRDKDLLCEVDGRRLPDALRQIINEIPDFVSRTKTKQSRIPCIVIMNMRYGLDGGRTYSYDEMAGEFSLSQRTMKTQHDKIVEHLRCSWMSNRLRPFIKRQG